MSSVPPRFLRNRMLASLRPSDASAIESLADSVNISAGQLLEFPNVEIEHLYFVEEGLVSVLAEGSHGKTVEVGMVGPEGMTGLCAILGNGRSPYRSLVQLGGRAQRIRAAELRQLLGRSSPLRTIIYNYVQIFTEQLSSTAFANRHAKLEERLARWLYMAFERVGVAELPLTHDSLAVTLGVRRAGVTDALHVLEGHALIRSRRGAVIIRDSDGLRRFSVGVYALTDPSATTWEQAVDAGLGLGGHLPFIKQRSYLHRS